MKELSFEDVMGGAPQQPVGATSDAPVTGEISFEDVMRPQTAPVTQSSASKELSFDDVTANPSIGDYLGEVGKRYARGLVDTTLTAPLHGLGAIAIPPRGREFEQAIDTVMRGGDLNDPRVSSVAMNDNGVRSAPITEHPAYKLGTRISKTVEGVLPDRNILNPVVGDVASGFGSLTGNLLMGLTPGVNTMVVPSMFLQGAGEAAERAVNAGATDDQIQRAANLGNIAGATELLDQLLLHSGSAGAAYGLMKRVGVNALKGAFIEGGQEGLQQFIQNIIAKGVYKPKQNIFEDVPYNTLIGALVGAPARVMLPEGQSQTPPSQQTLADAVAPTGPSTTPEAPYVAPHSPIDDILATPPRAAPVDLVGLAGSYVAPDGRQVQIEKTQEGYRTSIGGTEIFGPSTNAAATMHFIQENGWAKTEGPTPQTTSEAALTTMPAAVVEHIQRAAPPIENLQLPSQPASLKLDDLIAPTQQSREEIISSPGANTARLAKLLGPKLYDDPKDITKVSVKEMLQNSFDAVKSMLEKGNIEEGNIDIKTNPVTRTLSITDNGSGMTPSVLGNEFLQIASTHKESKRASGGLGIAKMLFIFGNQNLKVTTMRDGRVSQLVTTGPELFGALDDKSKAPKIQIRDATYADRQMFPNGHGTNVEVVIPQQYTEPGTGETKDIPFQEYAFQHPVLQRSPLFDNINVTLNNSKLDMGTQFPLENFTQFANVNFNWGSARIYVSKDPVANTYSNNVHVLSNGLWQFSGDIKKDPTKTYGENVERDLYIDVNPKVSPEDQGYPFDLNRQRFSPQTAKDFENIFKYIGLLYQQEEMKTSAQNFGSMQFLDYSADTKKVTASPTVKLEPKTKAPDNAITLIKPGDKVRVEDGRLLVNGREAPELTPDVIEKFKINPDSMRVEQSTIDPKRVILHDNTDVTVSNVETRAITDYGRERFGTRFDEFTYAIGNAFRELRDIVVRDMDPAPKVVDDGTPSMFKQVPFHENSYAELGREGIGISLDVEYRGVSIRLPFAGMFLNPFVPEYSDPIRAAVGMVGTMVHELAHHKVRSHDEHFPQEMQRILIMLDTNNNFNFIQFKQKVVNIVAAYTDVFNHMNGVYTSGNFTLQSRGKRFEDSSTEQVGDGSLSGDIAGLGRESESGSKLSDWVAKGQAIPETEQGRAGASLETQPSRSSRPSDNGRGRNYAATRSIDPGISVAPQQPETNVLRDRTTAVMGGGPLAPELKEAAAHADRVNWFYKYFAGLTELLDVNPNFTPLRKYVERVRAMHNDETKLHDAAIRILKDWRSLGEQAGNLNTLMLDVQQMPYLTPQERKNQMWRHPTQQEFAKLADKHKMSDEALKVYNRIRQLDEYFLRQIEQNAVESAQRRIVDPVKLAEKLDEIRASGRVARLTPFFPFTRFGRYFVSVRDSAGNLTSFETFEPRRFAGITVKRADTYQAARVEELKRKAPPGSKVESGVLPETAGPLIGMPTLLLQQMQGEDINLSPEQVEAVKQLQVLRNPAMRFNQRIDFNPTTNVPGYSLDLQRAFARYYFHGGRYFAKVKHAWGLRGNIAEAQLNPGNKSGLIASYMSDHLQNTVLDAKGDFGFFKGAIFLWTMGYVVSSATQNLTQTPMITLPFLAAKFNEVKAVGALSRAMAQLSTFYKRGHYDNMSGFEMQAISYGVKTGRISETQAPELAGIASGNNLIAGQGGTKLQRAAVAFQEKSAFMFEMAEQFNRRIVYRATLKLAVENPNSKFVKESIKKYNNEYQQLVTEFGGNAAQAAAVVTAIHSTDQTQFVYAKYARPRFMRGPLASTLFVFKRYIQSTILMLMNNKSDVLPRYLVMAMLLGGLGGVPGYDDLKSIFRAFGKWFFGKDFDVERAIRAFILDQFNGKIEPDLVLHGLARRGFGLPALMDLMGGASGRGLSYGPGQNVPFPLIDRSRAITMGNILPFDLGKMMEPTDKLDRTIADQTQKASGAVFSVGFNLYKSIMDKDRPATDFKRWEPAIPRALSSASRSYRAFTEGRERGKGGPNAAPTIVSYDIRDTEQMMEAFALLGGYQPLRQQAKWDSIIAKAEVSSYIEFKRKGLLDEYFEATKGKNAEEIAKVRDSIITYNKDLPDYAKGRTISGDSLMKSMQARERNLVANEIGIPVQRSKIGISKHIDQLFPEATVDVRRIK